jgi:hypothetical protein
VCVSYNRSLHFVTFPPSRIAAAQSVPLRVALLLPKAEFEGLTVLPLRRTLPRVGTHLLISLIFFSYIVLLSSVGRH